MSNTEMSTTEMSNCIECPETREEFKQLVKQNASKVVIVKGSATWCGPCRRSAPFFNECFNNLNKSKLLISLDVDEQSNVAAYLKIRSIPMHIAYISGEKQYINSNSSEESIAHFFKQCEQ